MPSGIGAQGTPLAFGGGGPRQATLEAEGIPVFVGGENAAQREQALLAAAAWKPDIVHLNRPGQADSETAGILRALVHPGMRVWETNVFAYADRSADRAQIDLHLPLTRWCLWKWSGAVRSLEPQSPATVVPNPVDCSQFGPATAEQKLAIRADWQIPPEAVVFGRVGQPTGGKWSPALVASFRTVARQSPQAWLAVCGLPSSLQAQVAALPAEIRSRVVELPLTDSDAVLRRYYGLMDVFVHASEKGESFGYVLCEAMLSGLPVITLSTPLRDNSQIEVVPHGRAGVVVRNRREMAQAMLRLAQDPVFAQALAAQGPGWVRQHYDIPVVTRRLVQMAPVVLASRNSRELAQGLAALGLDVAPVGPHFYSRLLQELGVQLTLRERFMAPAVNHRWSRRGIAALRSLQTLLKRYAERK